MAADGSTGRRSGPPSLWAVKLFNVRRGRAGRGAPTDPWRRFRAGLGLLLLLICAGTLGYRLLGLSVSDAVYQTVITITTVGYREIGTVSGGYQAFTIMLILFGTGTALYTLGVLIESLFEGRLDDEIRRRRMLKKINRLTGHVVLCGFGRVGSAIFQELVRAGREVVVVDRAELDPDLVTHSVLGEATHDDVLRATGLERAATLVLALDSDVDNLYVALTSRSMCPALFIVARSNDSSVEPKLRQAGVDRVVIPHEIGGSRMAALVLQPDVAEFLDVVMHDEQLEVRLAELPVTAGGPFAGRALSACEIRETSGSTVLAVRRDGAFVTNPPGHFVLGPGDVLIALGTENQLANLKDRARV